MISIVSKLVSSYGAGGGARTHTPSLTTDFESVSSANSNTPAGLQAKGKGACLSFLLCAQSDGFSILNFPEKVKMGFQKFCAGHAGLFLSGRFHCQRNRR